MQLQNHLGDFVLGAFVTDLYVDFQNSWDFILGDRWDYGGEWGEWVSDIAG